MSERRFLIVGAGLSVTEMAAMVARAEAEQRIHDAEVVLVSSLPQLETQRRIELRDEAMAKAVKQLMEEPLFPLVEREPRHRDWEQRSRKRRR